MLCADRSDDIPDLLIDLNLLKDLLSTWILSDYGMNAAAAASIILFIVVAAALNTLALQLYAARKLAWAWAGDRRSRYVFAFAFSIALALLAGATATLGILVWLRGGRILEIARDICSACAKLLGA